MLPGICLPHCTPRMSPGSGLPGNLQGQRGRTNSVPLGERTGEHPDEDVRLKSPHSNIWNSESFKHTTKLHECKALQAAENCDTSCQIPHTVMSMKWKTRTPGFQNKINSFNFAGSVTVSWEWAVVSVVVVNKPISKDFMKMWKGPPLTCNCCTLDNLD